ncbi:MAG: hypoxanthine-guanine phosphoribosyltransferase [Gammaproteobacteria bacterium]|nr:hypoxanthine-guanine phosphoribosyltransferase [Gammaproteobacteria bacterium]
MNRSSITAAQAEAALAEAELLFDEDQIRTALEKIATEISAQLADSDPLLISVLNGGLIPAGQLLPLLDFPLQCDVLHATRYRGETSGGELQWLLYPQQNLRGRTVLIVDDILDEGHTLKAILAYCQQQGVKQVQSAVLLEKKHQRRCAGVEADYVALRVDDRYVVGYGMDYHGYLRNAKGIYALDETAL